MHFSSECACGCYYTECTGGGGHRPHPRGHLEIGIENWTLVLSVFADACAILTTTHHDTRTLFCSPDNLHSPGMVSASAGSGLAFPSRRRSMNVSPLTPGGGNRRRRSKTPISPPAAAGETLFQMAPSPSPSPPVPASPAEKARVAKSLFDDLVKWINKYHRGQAETDQLQPFFDHYPDYAITYGGYIATAELEDSGKGTAEIRDIALQKLCADAGDAMQFNA